MPIQKLGRRPSPAYLGCTPDKVAVRDARGTDRAAIAALLGELGYPSVDVLTWVGIAGPPNVGAHVIEAWNKAMVEMVKDPDVNAKFKNIGARPFYLSAQDFKEYVRKEIEVYEKLYSK